MYTHLNHLGDLNGQCLSCHRDACLNHLFTELFRGISQEKFQKWQIKRKFALLYCTTKTIIFEVYQCECEFYVNSIDFRYKLR